MKRTLHIVGALASVLVIAGCSFNPATRDSGTESSASSLGPTSTAFAQNLGPRPTGDAGTIAISEDGSGEDFGASNIGISFEATDLADPRIDPAASNLDELLISLGNPALRFGGNGLDRRTFWTSTGETPPTAEQVAVTPDDLKRLKKLVDLTGSTVTIGIPLGEYDPKRGADMAANAIDILGESLVGISVGNEPNGYTVEDVPGGAVRDDDWDKTKYVEQLNSYVEAIMSQRPDAPIIGPDAFDGAWMDAFLGANVENTAALAQHWYQLYDCDSDVVPGRGPEPENLLDPSAKEAAKKNIGIGLAKADAAGLPLWLEETGPTSCGGTNDTSLTNAMSLWAADFTLYAASLGVDRLAMHSMLGACNGGAPMSLVCDPADHGTASNTLQGRPHFAAMRLLVPSIGGTFTKTDIDGGGNMSAYTVTKNDGATLVTTVINANDAADSGGNPVTLEIPDGFSVDRASQIYGPSNEAKNATEVIPANPLPDSVPYSGPAPTASSADDNDLRIDLAASSATVFIMSKG
ncbi:hypothetical protein [Brevibacterium casei]|uniref:hypothetical protein n=1 Tax=Brevibacterium casei TaxID=33889 RepID=UPI001F1F765D|nr:hypothetical protein [Brevibacterium casei]